MQITEHTGGGMEDRYYIDGTRATESACALLKIRARIEGGMHSLWTKGRTLPNGETRWTHGCSVR